MLEDDTGKNGKLKTEEGKGKREKGNGKTRNGKRKAESGKAEGEKGKGENEKKKSVGKKAKDRHWSLYKKARRGRAAPSTLTTQVSAGGAHHDD